MNDKIRLSTLIYAKSDFEEKLIKRLRWHETGSQEYCSIARKMITDGTIPQKRNRYRLFAKANLNNSKLEVYRYYKGIFRCKDYEEMQEEMMDIIDIHNQKDLNVISKWDEKSQSEE